MTGHIPATDWADAVHTLFTTHRVDLISFVPDGGHKRLIALCQADPAMRTVTLTTEKEGVALAAGAFLGGRRAALLMQSSGVGNCVNMLSLPHICTMPFLTLVTMRGEWGEFNPWQVPMGRATPQAFEIMGTRVIRVDRLEELGDVMDNATSMAFEGEQAIAVLLSQRLLGRKKWTAK